MAFTVKFLCIILVLAIAAFACAHAHAHGANELPLAQSLSTARQRFTVLCPDDTWCPEGHSCCEIPNGGPDDGGYGCCGPDCVETGICGIVTYYG